MEWIWADECTLSDVFFLFSNTSKAENWNSWVTNEERRQRDILILIGSSAHVLSNDVRIV